MGVYVSLELIRAEDINITIFLACGCSAFGSVREDCEQMTGRCVCKPGIQGQKCTVCTSHDKLLGPNGCVSGKIDMLIYELKVISLN